jgi:hypothetical protein
MDAFKVKKEAPKTEPCISDSGIQSHAGYAILVVIFRKSYGGKKSLSRIKI